MVARSRRLEPVLELSGPWSILRFARQPLRRFELARSLSPHAVAFRVLGLSYVVFFEPSAVEQILVARNAAFSKDRFTRDLRRVLGTGLLTSEGELWRRRRKLVAPSLQRQEIAEYGPVMAERAAAFVAEQPAGACFDVHSAMMHLTLDILVRALFGTELGRPGEVERVLDRIMEEYSPASESLRVSLPDWVPISSRARLAGLSAELDDILFELMARKKAALGAAEAAGTPAADLLTRLMRASDEEGSLSERALRDEAMTLFLAGHETTALTLTYALRLLALHPRERLQLQQELRRVLAGRMPTMADLPALPFTRGVIDESLRMYPPAWALAREPGEDIELDGVEIAAGTQLLVCPWIMHRDPRFFDEPERFWPERWTKPRAPRFAYLPFGAGPRVCIGNHFAIAEAVLVLATLVQRAEFQLERQPALRLMPTVTLRPGGPVLMRMNRRTP